MGRTTLWLYRRASNLHYHTCSMCDRATAQHFGELVGTFLEATVHEILHLRKIYSQDLFTRHRLYSVMVRKSRHPQLNDYIHHIVHSLQARFLLSLRLRLQHC